MVYDHVLTFDKEVSSSMGCCVKQQLINANRSTGSGRQCQIGIFMQLIAKQLADSFRLRWRLPKCLFLFNRYVMSPLIVYAPSSSIHVASISHCPCQLAGSWLSVRVS
jgi:hypothetical protein